MPEATEVLIASVVIVIALLSGLIIVDEFVSARDAGGGDTRVQRAEALLQSSGTFVDIADGQTGHNETVYQTTGYAINLSGASDSEFGATGVHDFGSDTSWHASVWAAPDAGTDRQAMKVASVSDGELIIYYNGSAGEWAAWYYRADTRDAYEVAVGASSPQGTLTNIQVRANGTHLAIYRNATVGEQADITSDSSADSPTEAGNWDGRIDELRVFDDPADSANRSALYNGPTEQRPGLNRSVRLMFDQPARPETLILIAGGSAAPTNTTFSAGHPADVMQVKNLANDLSGDSDYRFRRSGPEVAPVAGGELDGAPVAYVDYDRPGTDVSLVGLFGPFSQLAAIIPLVLVAALIIAKVEIA